MGERKEAGLWHKHELRVRYEETDRMGVVYHANYVNWFEWGRTELVRDLGMSYREIEAGGLLLPVVRLEADFRLPARYDDRIAVYTRVAYASPVRMTFESQVRRLAEPMVGGGAAAEGATGGESAAWIEPQGEWLVGGRTEHIWLNAAWKPVRVDKLLPELYARLDQEMSR